MKELIKIAIYYVFSAQYCLKFLKTFIVFSMVDIIITLLINLRKF